MNQQGKRTAVAAAITLIFIVTSCSPGASTQEATPEATVPTAAPTATSTMLPTPTEAPTQTQAAPTPTTEPAHTHTSAEGDTTPVDLPTTGENNEQSIDESDLLLPDLITLPPWGLRYLIDDENDRKFVRFANAVGNIGDGDVILYGEMTGNGTVSVTQAISSTTGVTQTLDVGDFIYHDVHGHWHWEGFSLYQVWSLNDDGTLKEPVGTSGKVSYCVRDFEPLADILPGYEAPEGTPRWPVYDVCGWEFQGLTVGWSDTYEENIAGQAVDISHLPDGTYALVSTADPTNRIKEKDENNNIAIVYFEIQGRIMKKLGTELAN